MSMIGQICNWVYFLTENTNRAGRDPKRVYRISLESHNVWIRGVEEIVWKWAKIGLECSISIRHADCSQDHLHWNLIRSLVEVDYLVSTSWSSCCLMWHLVWAEPSRYCWNSGNWDFSHLLIEESLTRLLRWLAFIWQGLPRWCWSVCCTMLSRQCTMRKRGERGKCSYGPAPRSSSSSSKWWWSTVSLSGSSSNPYRTISYLIR